MIMLFFFLTCFYHTFIYSYTAFIDSKHFASTYLINKDKITLCGYGTKDVHIITVPHDISCADSRLLERGESIMYATKEDPNVIYEFEPQSKISHMLPIPHIEQKPLFVHAIAANQNQLFVALSPEPEQFDCKEGRISCFYVQYSKEQGSQLFPCCPDISIDQIRNICEERITDISLKKMYFDQGLQRLCCLFNFCKDVDTREQYDYMWTSGLLEKNTEDNTILFNFYSIINPDIQKAFEEKKINDQEQYVQAIDSEILHTSTALSYIVSAIKNKQDTYIYALPLTFKGTLASKNSACEEVFFLEGLKRFIGRYFLNEVKNDDEISDFYSYESYVGNGNISYVKKIKILGDTVCALCDHIIYGSTAIFDQHGNIKGWTDWKKILEHQELIEDIAIDRFTGQYMVSLEDSIKKTEWHKFTYTIQDPLRAFCHNVIQINNQKKDQFFAIDARYCYKIDYENNADEHIKHVQQFEIKDIGELISIYNNYDEVTEKNYFLISGMKGIVFCSLDEDGFIEHAEKVSEISFVKKMIIDEGILYLLSDVALYRIILDNQISLQERFNHAELLIYTKNQINFGFLNDIIISDACALLASSKGIWLLKQGSIRKEIPEFVCPPFPESIGMPVSFFVRTIHHKDTDFARFCGSNIFVLFSDYSSEQSKLYRLSAEAIKDDVIDVTTVSFFKDTILREKPTSFLNFSTVQSTFFTDGIRYMLPSSGKQISLFPQPKLGIVWSGNKLSTLFNSNFQNMHILYTGTDLHGNLLISTEHELYIHA